MSHSSKRWEVCATPTLHALRATPRAIHTLHPIRGRTHHTRPCCAGVTILFGVIGAKLCGPVGLVLGSTQVAPGLIMTEAPRSSTSPLLAAGWHTWRFCARIAAYTVWSGREAARFAERSGLKQGLTDVCRRLDHVTHASAVAVTCYRLMLRVVMWPLRKMYEASDPGYDGDDGHPPGSADERGAVHRR